MNSYPRTARRARQWGIGIGMAGAAVAAAMIGMTSAPVARADTPEGVLDQAIQDLTQADQVFKQAPEALLDARALAALTPEENLVTTTESFTASLEADQALLPAADQAGLADADLSALHADQGVLEAAQGFVAADQAGDLTSWASSLPTEFATLNAELTAAGAASGVALLDLGAEFFNAIGVPDIFLP